MRDPMTVYSTAEYKEVHNKPTISFPKLLIMQASSYCNFNCLQCPRQVKVPRREITGLGNGFMQTDLIKKAAEEVKNEEEEYWQEG